MTTSSSGRAETRVPARSLAIVLATGALACQSTKEAEPTVTVASATPAPEPAAVLVDGSSTVLPISEAILALYASRLVTDITIASSGTGGGFQKFCQAEIAIAGASRPITAPEMKFCQSNGVEYIELPVAFDGIAVVVDKNNEYVKALSVKELQRLWEPKAEGSLVQWSDLRAGLPKQRIQLAGPGLESGTFDFFTRAVVGSERASRSDYKASEDDRELVEFVASTPGALGYFGLAYYAKNRDRLQAVAIDDGVAENGEGAIEPSPETVANGTYHPLSRPVFIYVNASDARRNEVRDFVEFYLRAARLVAPDVGYVALPQSLFKLAQDRFEQGKTGSIFDGEAIVGFTIEDLMRAETVATREAAAAARP